MNTRNVTITALNILDGMEHHKNWVILRDAWYQAGMGFIEFCIWIAEIAEESEKHLATLEDQDFPGVYDYEVSFPLGTFITKYVEEHGALPDQQVVFDRMKELADEFFEEEN